ncbi:MAG: DUF4397 domain-containing protein [Pseudomonadota bacterium]
MKLKSILLATTAIALAACDSDDPNPGGTEEPSNTFVRVIHASPNAPAVNLTLGTFTADGLDFKGTLGDIVIDPGTATVTVDALDAAGTITAIGPADITFDADTITTIIAANDVGSIEPIIVTQPAGDPAASDARVLVVHGAASAPEVDVYVTAPGADLAGETPLGTFEFRGSLGPVDVAAGDYQIRVTAAGDASAVVYDSGTTTLPGGLNAVLVATPNVEGGAAAITLVGHDRGTGTLEIRDTNAPATLRVVHLSPDAPAVDVIADTAVLFAGLTFPNGTDLTEVPPATYQVEVSPAGAYPGTVVIPNDGSTIPLELGVGTTTNVLAIDTLANITAITADDDTRSIGLYAKVRAIHASPTAPNVDIYVTAPGGDITAATPVATDVPFGANTGFLNLDNVADPGAADYDVTITATGSTTPAIGPIALEIADGDVITVIARDDVGGGAISADVVVLTN